MSAKKTSIKKEEVGLSGNDRYTYNRDSDTYIINLKCREKPLVLSGSRHRAICRAYSSWDQDLTCNQICRKFSLTPEIFHELARIFSLTKDREPLSIEEVEDKTIGDNVKVLLEEKRYKIYQEYEHESWKETKVKAKKWEDFQARIYDPWVTFVEGWEPPAYKKIDGPPAVKTDKHCLFSASDFHVGLFSNPRYNYFKKGWSHQHLEKSVKDYMRQIKEEMATRTYKVNTAYLLMSGDLCHTLSGYTDKGTKLESEHIGEEQLDLAFSVMNYIVNELLSIFPKIRVLATQGNHSSIGDYAVAKILEAYYRTEGRINFDITTKRYLSFKVEKTLFIMEHGYSAWYKSRLPRPGAARDNYINGLFLADPTLLKDVNHRVYLSADQHHSETKESNFYEHIMFSTIVGGDRHSDNCGYVNRARQNMLVVDKSGLREVVHFYFD